MDGYSKTRGRLSIVACEAGLPFARKVVTELNNIYKEEKINEEVPLIESKEMHFANSELKTEVLESIRGNDVFVIQDVENSTLPYSVNDNFTALKTAVGSVWRGDAKRIVIVMPTYPYARQDKAAGREAITAAQAAYEMELFARHVLTLDIHNTAIAGFFRKARLEDLHASKNIIEYVQQNLDLKNLIVVAPDAGGGKRAEYYASKLETGIAFIYKTRDYSKPNSVSEVKLLGDVNGKDVLLVDDIIDTAGTLIKTVELLKQKNGARKVYFACSLPLFNGPAIEKLDAAYARGSIDAVIGTDAVYHGDDFSIKHPWYQQVSVAKYFARVIFNINRYKSITELLK